MTKTFTERTGQDRLLDVIKTVTELISAGRAMSVATMLDILPQLIAANTEIAAEMAELINAKPGHCCACGEEHGPKYIYSGICDSCYEDRIA